MHKIKEKEIVYLSIVQMFRFIINTELDILTNLFGINMDEMLEERIRVKIQLIDLYTKAPIVIGRPEGDHNSNWIEYCINLE